jgi:archaemetzincin
MFKVNTAIKYSFRFIFLLFFFSCQQNTKPTNITRATIIQPFNDLSASQIEIAYNQLKIINPNIVLRTAIALPSSAFYKIRNRYRADSLIRFLNKFGSTDTIVIGMTSKDISTTKGIIQDWGVMGLGYCPGNACVVSTFRLTKKKCVEQFYKVAIHELGHTQGLPHCANKTCYMRDAEGGNPLNEEINFCALCKTFLQHKGWVLN